MGRDIFIISEVCSVKNPKSSHLFAPFISLPKNMVANINSIDKTRKIPENVL